MRRTMTAVFMAMTAVGISVATQKLGIKAAPKSFHECIHITPGEITPEVNSFRDVCEHSKGGSVSLIESNTPQLCCESK